jgi:uncharacterized protein
MDIIDCHVHLSPCELPAELIAECARLGIGRMIVAALGESWDYEPAHEVCVAANDDTARAMAEHPGLVLGWAYVNPRFVAAARDEVRRCIGELGFSGIKLWTAAHATEPCVEHTIDQSVALGVPVLMHAWNKATGNLPKESTPAMVAELSRRRPEARIIMAHAGGDFELGVRAVEDTSALVDISGSIVEQGFVEICVSALGASRVVFGTDAPLVEPAMVLAKVMGARVREADRALILAGNMQALLDGTWSP